MKGFLPFVLFKPGDFIMQDDTFTHVFNSSTDTADKRQQKAVIRLSLLSLIVGFLYFTKKRFLLDRSCVDDRRDLLSRQKSKKLIFKKSGAARSRYTVENSQNVLQHKHVENYYDHGPC